MQRLEVSTVGALRSMAMEDVGMLERLSKQNMLECNLIGRLGSVMSLFQSRCRVSARACGLDQGAGLGSMCRWRWSSARPMWLLLGDGHELVQSRPT